MFKEISFLNDVEAAEKVQQLMHIGLQPNRQLNETSGSVTANLSQATTNSSPNGNRSEESAEKNDARNSEKQREFTVHYIYTGNNRNRSKRLYEKNSSFDVRNPDISEKKSHKPGNFLYIKEREIQIFMPKSPVLNGLNIQDNPQYIQSNELNPYVKTQEVRSDRINDHDKGMNDPIYEANANNNEGKIYGDLPRSQMQGNVAINLAPGKYPSWYQLKLQSPKSLTQNLKPAVSFFKDEIEQQRYSKEAFKVGQSQTRDVLRNKALPFPARMAPRDSKNDAEFYTTVLKGKGFSTTGGFHAYLPSEFEISTQEYQTSAVLQNNSNPSMNVNLRRESINFLFPQNPLNFQLAASKRNERDFMGLLGNMLPSEKYRRNSELIFKRRPREPRHDSPTNQTENVSAADTIHNFKRRKKESDNYHLWKYLKRNANELFLKPQRNKSEKNEFIPGTAM
ncbi:uncharacterized protein LOC118191729 isoform X2 [Stegodyphus dumicola]|uniref:uncharacterized protein LOC118191729 isoform X2 n=1 Tax=Stegodyphus dumicola TaxID=202533 RepID=UPI0015ABA1BA|nr:uncharacterized protein LOC118191729 isoform X2 [Stegodyphus dumicola]